MKAIHQIFNAHGAEHQNTPRNQQKNNSYLPEELISYIIYHEMTHLIEKKHNEKF